MKKLCRQTVSSWCLWSPVFIGLQYWFEKNYLEKGYCCSKAINSLLGYFGMLLRKPPEEKASSVYSFVCLIPFICCFYFLFL